MLRRALQSKDTKILKISDELSRTSNNLLQKDQNFKKLKEQKTT